MLKSVRVRLLAALFSVMCLGTWGGALAGGGKPTSFTLTFDDGYLVHVPGSGSQQLVANLNVVSYGQDWQIVRVNPFLYHAKHQSWRNQYLKVNTSREEAYLSTGPNFGRIGDGNGPALFKVDSVGDKNDPTRFFIRFPEMTMTYRPGDEFRQVRFTAGKLLVHDGSQWEATERSDTVYWFRQTRASRATFYWKVNTEREMAYRASDPKAPCTDTVMDAEVGVTGGDDGTNYTVYGCVYSADERDPAEPYPSDAPLADVTPPGAVLGRDTLTATAPRTMVKVSVKNPATGRPYHGTPELAPFGDYTISFRADPTKFQGVIEVTDAVTDGILHVTERTAFYQNTPQAKYPLVPGEVTDGSGEIPFPLTDNTGLFTRVGAIELAHISDKGFANPPRIAAQWSNAPFGGTLTFKGAFTRNFYPQRTGQDRYCYKVRVDAPSGPDFYLNTPMTKYRYTVLRTGRVLSEPVRIGPFTDGSVSDCYRLTPLSEDPGPGAPANAVASFVSAPDHLIRWNTGGASGKHSVSLELYEIASGRRVPLLANDNLAVELYLDNTPVRINFDQLAVMQGGSVVTDLNANKCAIADLSGGRQFRIDVTAEHPTGFLANWALSARSNAGSAVWREGDTYGGESFTGTRPAPFTGRGMAAAPVDKSASDFDGPCAYVFGLSARARTTNGYSRFNRAYRQTFYFVDP